VIVVDARGGYARSLAALGSDRLWRSLLELPSQQTRSKYRYANCSSAKHALFDIHDPYVSPQALAVVPRDVSLVAHSFGDLELKYLRVYQTVLHPVIPLLCCVDIEQAVQPYYSPCASSRAKAFASRCAGKPW
jgi:hypothetical protein